MLDDIVVAGLAAEPEMDGTGGDHDLALNVEAFWAYQRRMKEKRMGKMTGRNPTPWAPRSARIVERGRTAASQQATQSVMNSGAFVTKPIAPSINETIRIFQ